ncbi:ATP-dependent RNA helicase [Melia azedarach]|uniref:ATP-dependent RNA helicase n=1 Tax=Melia azedarach TaxID=155640 RepID=A0ACC1YVN4_MELAZ|nr:ATP-dependent RNA helicase [Melia azedarach]
MVKLCLMASHVYPPGLVLPQEQGMTRVIKDCQPYMSCQGARQEVIRSGCLNLRSHQSEEPWKPISGLFESNQLVKLEPAVTSPVLIGVQDTRPDSVLFSMGIAKQCTRHEKIMQFLASRSSEAEGAALDLSLLSDLMGLQTLTFDVNQQPSAPPPIYPTNEFFNQKPLLDFVGDMVRSSKITIHPDGKVLFTGSGAEVNDFLSVVAEFYLSQNAAKWSKQSLLIPHFNRPLSSQALANICGSSLRMETTTVAPLKSPEKIKVKPPSKKTSKKIGRERDLYQRNYFHACESLLSLMINKRQHGRTAILSLKKSGPELPELLTQFSAGIAGTGLAVLFSVICKVAAGRVPFCGYKVLNTGLAFGLVWLSWGVNKLRDTIVYISKNASKMGVKEEEMIKRVNKSVNDIYFRAATLMAVAVLRLA